MKYMNDINVWKIQLTYRRNNEGQAPLCNASEYKYYSLSIYTG